MTNNDGGGPAILADDATLINSTVSGNTGYNGAAGVGYPYAGRLTLINSTVAHNSPAPGIGPFGTWTGIAPVVLLRNSIISNNGFPQQNCRSTLGVLWSPP